MAQPFSIAGAHLKCYINGKLLGYVVAVPAWNIQTNWGELNEIDNAQARALAPRRFAVNGTIQILRGRYTGGLEGAGLVPTAETMLGQKYLTIELQDRISQDIVFRALLCQVDQQQWQINPKGLVIGTFNFKGLGFGNEAQQ